MAGTKPGPAKYKHRIDNQALETEALVKGGDVNNGKNWKIYDTGSIVGAKNGEETQYMRIEITGGGDYHGHPITKSLRKNKYG